MSLTRYAQRIAHRGAGHRAAQAGGAVLAAGLVATALPTVIPAVAGTRAPAVSYTFRTLNNSNDETFNQLLGINNRGKIAGYFGSGAKNHPNKGYLLLPPYHQSHYRVENFPGSVQTQVTGLNDAGVSVGFYSRSNKANPAANANFGFYLLRGRFHRVVFPTRNNSVPPVNQLLGVNNKGIAVGFYIDSRGNAHGYRYNVFTHRFSRVSVPGAVSLTAAAINSAGSIAGFFTDSKGITESFLIRSNGEVIIFAKAHAGMTQAFGVNKFGEVVGAYTVGANTYGFTWSLGHGFRTVNDPRGIGSTLINGVNDHGDLVGFYTDSKGNTDGFLAIP